jgi:hypothetical protein
MSVAETGDMSTPVSTPALLRRVAARAGLGLWRQRGGLLLAVLVTAALGGYVAVAGPGQSSLGVGLGAAPGSPGDCADAAIAAIANKSPSAAQSAYQCMDPSFQQRVPEQVFVQQIRAQALPNVQSVARVGDYHTPQGGSMVYYAVDANGQTIGYIIYLGQDGKVVRIE